MNQQGLEAMIRALAADGAGRWTVEWRFEGLRLLPPVLRLFERLSQQQDVTLVFADAGGAALADMDDAMDELSKSLFRHAISLGANLHLELVRGQNDHHKIEALFKAFARAMRKAVEADARVSGVPSTKGAL